MRWKRCGLRLPSLYGAKLAIDTALFDGCQACLDELASRAMPWGIGPTTGLPHHAAAGIARTCTNAGAWSSGDTLPQRKPHPAPLLLALATVVHLRSALVATRSATYSPRARQDMPVSLARYGYLGPRFSGCVGTECS